MTVEIYIVGALLFLFSIIDIKWRQLPSILLTGTLLVLAIINYPNLQFGIFAGLFALLLYEFGEDVRMQFGTADIKITIMLGLMISTLYGFIIFLSVFAVFQFCYIAILRKTIYKKGEMPFIPCLFFVFLALAMAGVVA